MPYHARWEPFFESGHDAIDAQHRDLLAQCEGLAELCAGGEGDGARFDAAFERLKTSVREHLGAEVALLDALGDPDVEAQRDEQAGFDDLAAGILTTANFDRLELQRFVAVWCLGHVVASAAHLRERLAGGHPPGEAAR